MGKKDDSLIIKSSKESKYGQCFCCCLLILMAFICKEEGLFAVCLIAALILLRVAMLSNEILILQANGLTVKRGKKERIYKWKEICQGCFQHKKHDFSFDKLNNKPSNLPEQD